jgi:hypothetical protein
VNQRSSQTFNASDGPDIEAMTNAKANMNLRMNIA